MSGRDRYRHIEAFIDQEQTEWTVGGRRQLVTVMMSGDSEAVGTAACQLTARRARDLAFQLLVEAEHADRLTDRRGEDDQ